MSMSGTRYLTRNPLTSWQRLVDDNLNSLGDGTLKSRRDNHVNFNDGEKCAAKSPTSAIYMKATENNKSSKSYVPSMSSQTGYLNCSRRHNDLPNEEMTDKHWTNRNKSHTPDVARCLSRTHEQKSYENNVEDRTGLKRMKETKQSNIDLTSNHPKRMHSIRDRKGKGNKKHFCQAATKLQSVQCREFETCQSHESIKYPTSVHSTKDFDAIEIDAQRCQSSSSTALMKEGTKTPTSVTLSVTTSDVTTTGKNEGDRLTTVSRDMNGLVKIKPTQNTNLRLKSHSCRKYKSKLHDPRPINNKELVNNKQPITVLFTNNFSLNDALNNRITSENLQRLFNIMDINILITMNRLLVPPFHSNDNPEGDVGHDIWASNLQIIGSMEEQNIMAPLKLDIKNDNILEPSKLLKNVGISEDLISKNIFNSKTEIRKFELSYVDFGAGGDSTFQGQELTGSNITDVPFRMSTSDFIEKNFIVGQCSRYDLYEDYKNIVNRSKNGDKQVTPLHKEYRRRRHRCGSYNIKFRKSSRKSDVCVEDNKSLEVGQEFNRLDLEIGDGLRNSFQNPPLAEYSEGKGCNLSINNDSDVLEYGMKNNERHVQNSFSSQHVSDHQIMKLETDRPYNYRFDNKDNDKPLVIKSSASEMNIQERGEEWENNGFGDSARDSTELVKKCNTDRTHDILKSHTTRENGPETYKSINENSRKYSISTSDTLPSAANNRIKVPHEGISKNANDFRSRIGHNIHVTTNWKENNKFIHDYSRNQQHLFHLDKTVRIMNNILHIPDQGEKWNPSQLHDGCEQTVDCKDAKDFSHVMKIDSTCDTSLLRKCNTDEIIEAYYYREMEKHRIEQSPGNVNRPNESHILSSELEINGSNPFASVHEEILKKPICDRLLSKEIEDDGKDSELRYISKVNVKEKKGPNSFGDNPESTFSNENEKILLNQELMSKVTQKDKDPSSTEIMSLDKTDIFMNSDINDSDREILIREGKDIEFSLTNKQTDKNVFLPNKDIDNNGFIPIKNKCVCLSRKEMDKDVFESNKMKDLNVVMNKTVKEVFVSNEEKGRNTSGLSTATDKIVLKSVEKTAKGVHLSNKDKSGDNFFSRKISDHKSFLSGNKADNEVSVPNTKTNKAIAIPNSLSNVLDPALEADKEVFERHLQTEEDIYFLNKEADKSFVVANKETNNNVFIASKNSYDDTALLPFIHSDSAYGMKNVLCNNELKTKERHKADIEGAGNEYSIAKNVSFKNSTLWENKHRLQKDCVERLKDKEYEFSKSNDLPVLLPALPKQEKKKKSETYVVNETKLCRREEKSNTSERSPDSSFSLNAAYLDEIVLPNKSDFYEMSVQIVQPQQNCDFLDLYVNKFYEVEGTQEHIDIGNQNKSETENELFSSLELTGKSQSHDDLSQSSLECLLEQLIHRGKITKAYVISLDREIMAQSKSASISHSDVIALCDGVMGHYDGLMKITISDVVYTCFQSDNFSLLMGRAADSVLVVKIGSSSLVAGFAPPYTNGSCLKEITEFAEVLKGRGL